MKILGIIPARYESTRFPGKPLVEIQGKSMIQRVYMQASSSDSLDKVVIATDDQRILEHAGSFTENVVMTSRKHPSGTDRCREAMEMQDEKFDFVINIQGDEPFIDPAQIDLLSNSLSKEVELASLIKQLKNNRDLFNPNVVKVVKDLNNYVIYFSRNPIPFLRNEGDEEKWVDLHHYFKHIGIYAYRSDILKKITELKPSSLEIAESLEQLRWLENGYQIKVTETVMESKGIDTPEDLESFLDM